MPVFVAPGGCYLRGIQNMIILQKLIFDSPGNNFIFIFIPAAEMGCYGKLSVTLRIKNEWPFFK